MAALLFSALASSVPIASSRLSYSEAHQKLDRLAALGVDYDDVVQTLEDEGVKKFEDAWYELIEQVTQSLKDAGAEVSEDGSTKPAGQGPAAADREGSGR